MRCNFDCFHCIHNDCINDGNSYNQKYYDENRDKILAWQRGYYLKKRDKIISYQKEYRRKNRDKVNALKREWNQKNKDKISALHKEYFKKNRDKIVAYNREWRKKNRDKIAAYNRKYRKRNKKRSGIMRFDKFKRIYKGADKIIFSTKDDKCYIFDGFTALKFDKDLKGKVLENLGFAGCELEEFAILKEDGDSRIEKNEKSDVYKYFEDVDVIPAKYTGLILDGKIKENIFDAGEELLKFNSNYIDMAEQLTDGMNTFYDKKSKKVLFFYGEKIDVLILTTRSNKEDSKYLSKEFIF